MRVLSVDPGYDRLGVAIIEKDGKKNETLLYSNCITTSKKLNYPERLEKIANEVENLIKKYSPQIFASESLFFTKNQKTAIDVAGSRGMLLYIANKNNLKIFEYTPLQIKIAITGYGKSDKNQVQSMTRKLIKIDENSKLDDEYDAIAVGLTCFAIEKI